MMMTVTGLLRSRDREKFSPLVVPQVLPGGVGASHGFRRREPRENGSNELLLLLPGTTVVGGRNYRWYRCSLVI
jgi:hypothetical protein